MDQRLFLIFVPSEKVDVQSIMHRNELPRMELSLVFTRSWWSYTITPGPGGEISSLKMNTWKMSLYNKTLEHKTSKQNKWRKDLKKTILVAKIKYFHWNPEIWRKDRSSERTSVLIFGNVIFWSYTSKVSWVETRHINVPKECKQWWNCPHHTTTAWATLRKVTLCDTESTEALISLKDRKLYRGTIVRPDTVTYSVNVCLIW